jgi:tetratricopeptide (TPR) repeat protein
MIPFATPKLVIGIAVTMGAIYSADQFLASLEHRELDAQARHAYSNGVSLLRDGHNAQASEAFRTARSLDRDNVSFQLALADALIRDRQPDSAEDALSGILDKDSNDGQANLMMARAMDEQRRYTSADSFFHRAIYGTWPPNTEGQQINARIELVHWLVARGDQKALLSELILLEPLAASDPRIARELPSLFQQAGATSRAIDAYRRWLQVNPADAEAYAGLGQSEIQSGNFRAARQSFDRAAELKPDNAAWKQSADVALNAMEMDPTPRWLSSQEKLERSTHILALASSMVAACTAAQPEDSQLLQKAQQLIGEKKPAVTNEAAEMRLDFAETIWNTRPVSCNQAPETDQLLSVLMRKISQ